MRTALIVVDVQNDFCHGGTLAVRGADAVVDPINRLIQKSARRGWRVFLTRDWHPRNHLSFRRQGGQWPPHCIADSQGAAFHPALNAPKGVTIVSKATAPHQTAHSAFEDTNLRSLLALQGVDHVIVTGLPTDYCVKNTVLDALRFGFSVTVVEETIRAVNVNPGDGVEAVETMRKAGAEIVPIERIIGAPTHRTTIMKRVALAPIARQVKHAKPAKTGKPARKRELVGTVA
ncbi:MAG: isochorismatase family protein [Kiritimatiellia bacterium]